MAPMRTTVLTRDALSMRLLDRLVLAGYLLSWTSHDRKNRHRCFSTPKSTPTTGGNQAKTTARHQLRRHRDSRHLLWAQSPSSQLLQACRHPQCRFRHERVSHWVRLRQVDVEHLRSIRMHRTFLPFRRRARGLTGRMPPAPPCRRRGRLLRPQRARTTEMPSTTIQ